jgi:hypothetical protein
MEQTINSNKKPITLEALSTIAATIKVARISLIKNPPGKRVLLPN